MRPELLPPAVDDRLAELICDAYDRLEHGETSTALTEHLAAESGLAVEPGWLDGVFGSCDPTAAAWALRLANDPGLVRRVQPTRDELVEIVERIMPMSPLWDREHEPYWTALLQANVPHSAAAALIYNPPDGADPASWGAQAVVSHALSFRPIEL